MRAITIYQPWASLIAEGYKTSETRSWRPPQVAIGEHIAIHAAARYVNPASHIPRLVRDACWQAWGPGPWNLPRGAVVAIARLAGVVETTGTPQRYGVSWSPWEIPDDWPDAFGDYSAGRYAWHLEDVQKLAEPVPARGRQRLWQFEPAAADLA